MPRQARIDHPGLLHHVIVRGIDKQRIFRRTEDNKNIISRLEDLIPKTKTQCHAWALMPNHFHLLVTTGKESISTFMQSLLTGYAIYFNHRYKRVGHLFQNRFKSIVCDRDEYFIELVRYIHLNPLRGQIVKDMEQLDVYPWCGHSALIGKRDNRWQEVDSVLALFGNDIKQARAHYRSYMVEGISQGRRTDLTGGGLIRSAGGWAEAIKMQKDERVLYDERILGTGDFVEQVLNESDEKQVNRKQLHKHGWTIEKIMNKAADTMNVVPEAIFRGTKQRNISEARALACKFLYDDFGMRNIEIAKHLGLSAAGVCSNVKRGRILSERAGVSLEEVNK